MGYPAPMRLLALLIMLTPAPIWAGEPAEPEIKMIDGTKLTVEELMAMAAAEREAEGAHTCCDWGGMGCQPEKVIWSGS